MTSRLHRGLLLVAFFLVAGLSSRAWAKWEEEQLTMENQLHQRIESILTKTLGNNNFLVTVKVELGDNPRAAQPTTRTVRAGTNPFLENNRFVLPGVPEKKAFNTTPAQEETTEAPVSSEPVLKKLSISVLVSEEVPANQIASLRDLISSAVPFNPLRGDEMEVANSPLIKSAAASVKPTPDPAAVSATGRSANSDFWHDSRTLLLLGFMAVIVCGLLILAAFLFGPVRAFFNRLLAALPRIGEQAMYAANARENPAALATAQGQLHGNGHGNGDGKGEQLAMPFQFIREEQLAKMPLLFQELTATQAAVVLAYLPPAWASRMLTTLDPVSQTAILKELSQSREIPAEMVREVEAQVKERLPYYVGGMDWIQSVYQSAQPQMQRTLLNTLSSQAPQLAQTLRRKTFFFEDLSSLEPGGMRLVVQDASYPIVALALKDEKPEFRDQVLARLPGGIAEIVRQEYELSSGDDKKAIADAKERLVTVARRLLAENRIVLGAGK